MLHGRKLVSMTLRERLSTWASRVVILAVLVSIAAFVYYTTFVSHSFRGMLWRELP